MMKYMTRMLAVLIVVSAAFAIACERPGNSNAEQKQAEQTEQMQNEAYRQTGMPELSNFSELKMANLIMELRDRRVPTYTYFVDWKGRLHFVCHSIGYGLPYSTQMTNPKQIADRGHNYGYAIVPQPEPNALYMPDNVNATWIACLDETDNSLAPIYSEPKLMVSPFPLKSVNEHPLGSPEMDSVMTNVNIR